MRSNHLQHEWLEHVAIWRPSWWKGFWNAFWLFAAIAMVILLVALFE